MHEYEAIVRWSADDGVYVAEAPELPGCMAHGATPEEARKRIAEAMQLWLDTAREFGDRIPTPKGRAAAAPRSGTGR